MTRDELQNLYLGLLDILRKQGFLQISENVEALVEEGIIRRKKIKVKVAEDSLIKAVALKNTGRTLTVYQREDFSELERLILLLDVIEATVTDVADVRRATVEVFAQQAENQGTTMSPVIYLYTDVASQTPLVLEVSQVKAEADILRPLKMAISLIRQEIQNANKQSS